MGSVGEGPRSAACSSSAMGSRFQHVRVFGSNRTQTEDAAEVFDHGDSVVVVVADGVGGIHGGATASRALVAAVRSADAASALFNVRHWSDVFRSTDTALARTSGGQSTGVVVAVRESGIVGVSTGDSEAWVIHRDSVEDLTVGQNVKQRLGSGHVMPTPFASGPLGGPLWGVVLVATDGLLRYAARDIIARIVRDNPIALAAEKLLELVRLPSGKFHDDVAAVLVGRADQRQGGGLPIAPAP
jgi:PPM family protein phosphatase